MRSFPTILALLIALSHGAAVHAASEGSETGTVDDLEANIAPLALSGDGQVLVRVDAQHVLHRALLANPAQERKIRLPTPVRTIVLSQDGQVAAMRTWQGCIAEIDLGPGPESQGTLRWLVASFPGQQFEPARSPEPWSDEPAAQCSDAPEHRAVTYFHPALALSPDGHLLATDNEVIDAASGRLLATLRRHSVRTQFVDGGRQLLAVGAAGLESNADVHGRLGETTLATWTLADRALTALRRRVQPAAGERALVVDVQAASSTIWWIDTLPAASELAGGSPAPGRAVLRRWRPLDCTSAGSASVDVGMRGGRLTQLVVDSRERWVATIAHRDDAKGGWDELVVQAIADGRELVRRRFDRAPKGLLATADGTRLLAMAAAPRTADGNEPTTGEMIDIAIDVRGLRAATFAGDGPHGCSIDGAPVEALAVARSTKPLPQVWRVTVPRPTAQTEDRNPAPLHCLEWWPQEDQAHIGLFFRDDATLWVDRRDSIAQLDPATGRTLRALPTPRVPKVCTVDAPDGRGFFNVQGDTLTWRSLEGAATTRRVVDHRPGWFATGIEAADRAVRVVWQAKAGTDVAAQADGSVRDLVVASYDATGRRLGEEARVGGDRTDERDPAIEALRAAPRSPCHDDAGAIVDAVAWRLDAFGSLRAFACTAPDKPAWTLLWADADIAPRAGVPRAGRPTRSFVAHDGNIGVAVEGQRLQVFDAEQRLELGEVALAEGDILSAATVSQSARLLIVRTVERANWQAEAVLTAYRIGNAAF